MFPASIFHVAIGLEVKAAFLGYSSVMGNRGLIRIVSGDGAFYQTLIVNRVDVCSYFMKVKG